MNKKSEITKEVIEEKIVSKPTKKAFKVGLVTKSSIVYDDDGVSKFISRKGHENLVIGDILKI